MNLSMILTVNNRPPEISRRVAESLKLPGNQPDELIVVLDRPTLEARGGAVAAYTDLPFSVRFVEVSGEQGWKGPAKAWNAGFAAADGDFFYCISSEVVQDAGNVEKARNICKDGNSVIFGSCHNSIPENLVVGAEPGELVSARMPRPLGFIACMPSWAVKKIGGFDEEFMGTPEAPNYWYDDDSFFLEMWQTGVNFIFDDSIHGIHLHHERPVLNTPEGQAGIKRNREYMLKKHGTVHPWPDLIRIEERREGRLVWKHL